MNQIINGDCLEVMRTIPDMICCVNEMTVKLTILYFYRELLTIEKDESYFKMSKDRIEKRILEKHGFITIEKRIYESVQRCRKAIMGTVYYSRPTKNTILIMPDNLIIHGV